MEYQPTSAAGTDAARTVDAELGIHVEYAGHPSLSQGDEYVSRARVMLLEVVETVAEQIQQVGPPLCQAMVEEVVRRVSKLRAAVTEADRLLAPQPAADAGSVSPELPKRIFLNRFSEDELVQVLYELRFPDFLLHKQLKPLNAAYLRLLEEFHLLTQGAA